MPQRENISSSYRYTAEEDIGQFLAVVEGAADKGVALPGSADVGGFAGVTQHSVLSGAEVTLATPGSITRCIAGAAITRGAPVSIHGTTGKVKTAAPGAGANSFLIGFARSTCTTDGDTVFVELIPSVMQGA